MIEQTVIDYLRGQMSVPVGPQIPDGPPASYCVVSKSGSDERDGLRAALIAVRSCAPSMWEAMCLSNQVRNAMLRMREDVVNVFSARCSTEYENNSTAVKECRYVAVFRVVYTERSNL